MKHFTKGADRHQSTLLRLCLDKRADDYNAVRRIDDVVDILDLTGFMNCSVCLQRYFEAYCAKLIISS
jgi:transposase